MMPYSWLDRRDLSMDFGTICGVWRNCVFTAAPPHSSQPRRLIPLEITVVPAEYHALQAFGISDDQSGHPLALHHQVIHQAVHGFNHDPMNHGVALRHFG